LEQFTVTPNEETRAGRMLAQGHLVVTVRSLKTNDHITVKFASKQKPEQRGQRWESVPFAEASHVFVSEYAPGNGWGGSKVGTYYPQSGKWYDADNVSPSRTFAAMQAIALAEGRETHPQAEVTEHDYCGRCGRELTDPDSIGIGIGPDCEVALGIGDGKRTSKVARERAALNEEAERIANESTPQELAAARRKYEAAEAKQAERAKAEAPEDPSLAKIDTGALAGMRESLATALATSKTATPDDLAAYSKMIGRIDAETKRREVGPQDDDEDGTDIFGAPLDAELRAEEEML
jgi:Family of unknown function (DUF6011)